MYTIQPLCVRSALFVRNFEWGTFSPLFLGSCQGFDQLVHVLLHFEPASPLSPCFPALSISIDGAVPRSCGWSGVRTSPSASMGRPQVCFFRQRQHGRYSAQCIRRGDEQHQGRKPEHQICARESGRQAAWEPRVRVPLAVSQVRHLGVCAIAEWSAFVMRLTSRCT